MLVYFTMQQLRELQTLVLGQPEFVNSRISPESRMALAVRLHAAMSDLLEEAAQEALELVN